MNGLELVIAERRRQIEAEGYTSDHDHDHTDGELIAAAECYLAAPRFSELVRLPVIIQHGPRVGQPWTPDGWPWAARYWKPTPNDRIRELVKAAALIVAEIDRLMPSSSNPESVAAGRALFESMCADLLAEAKRDKLDWSWDTLLPSTWIGWIESASETKA